MSSNKHGKELEEALNKIRMYEVSESFLQSGSWTLDIPKGIVTVSKGWQAVHGIEQSQLTIEQLMPIAHPDDVEMINQAFECSIVSGNSYQITHRVVRQDTGEIRTVKAYAEILEADDKSTPTKMFGMIQDITELQAAEDKLKFLAMHDALTSLPNRLLSLDRLASAIKLAKRSGKLVAVMFVDLDGFKQVNDNYGHDTGDCLLKSVAQRLLSSVRESDTVARIGGDEFLILLPDISTDEEASIIADKIIKTMSEPFELGHTSVTISCSVGTAIYPKDASSAERLMQLADTAMYTVKDNGKNGMAFYMQ